MKSFRSGQEKIRIIKITVFLLLMIVIGEGYHLVKRSYIDPVVMEVKIESEKVTEPIKYVFFADLHENSLGKGNEQLYAMIRDFNPDFILIGGDLIRWTTADGRTYTRDVIKNLSEISDVYLSLGNHEIEYLIMRNEIDYTNRDRDNSAFNLLDKDDNGFIEAIRDAGGVVLQQTWTDVEVRGTKIRIGGAFEDMYSQDEDHPGASMQPGMYSFLSEFQDTDALTLYMAHRPSSFLLGNGSSLWDIDVIMCGHEHGGQVVIPFAGGLFSRERGFFPDYTHGYFLMGNTTLIVTSGLGSDFELLPRFNNPPEIVFATVQ